MEKYYITADVYRKAKADECVPGAVFCGRVKAVVEAEAWREAFAYGKKAIVENLPASQTAINFGWMPVKDAKKMGDTEIYDKYKTVAEGGVGK